MRKIINSLAFSLILSAIIFAPDFILKLFTDAAQVQLERRYVRVIFLICLGLAFTKNRPSFYSFLIIAFILEFIELHHLAYFGLPLHPLNIEKVFTEWDEILVTGLPYFKDVYFVSLILLACYSLAIWLFEKCRKHLYSLPYLFPILVVFGLIRLAIPVYNDKPVLIEYFCPSNSRASLYNISSSCYYYLVTKYRNTKSQELNWQEYQVKKLNHKAKNIILIVGESLRYDHLSLYGYERQTSPFLDSLKNNQDFLYKKAISGSTYTLGSVALLFNVVEEPGNVSALYHKTTNLFRLAKENGYRTSLITAQELTSLANIGNAYIDYTLDRFEVGKDNYAKLIDDMLPLYARELELGEYNFIILHQRNLHSPYEGNYKHHGTKFVQFSSGSTDRVKRLIDTYDNAALYYDYNIEQIFHFFTDTFRDKGESYLFFTSDHGELLGENGLFGHVMSLDVNLTSVPFWVYGLNKNEEFWASFKPEKQTYNHFEIGQIIANRLGYQIINNNTPVDKGYICLSLEQEQFIEYKRNSDGSIASWRLANTNEFPQKLNRKNN